MGADLLWLDGVLLDRAEARIDPGDRGLLLGDGIFETVLVRAGRVLYLEQHLQRLGDSAAFLGIPLPVDVPGIATAIGDLLAAKKLPGDLAALRITLTRGVGQRGLLPPEPASPHLMITAAPYHRPAQESFKARLVNVRRNEGSPLSRVKSLNYLDNVLAQQEAVAQGADEALLRNNAGYLCCGGRSNLFLLRRGVLATPPVSDGVLAGIQRQAILKSAAMANYRVVERSLVPTELLEAEEVFVCNSLIEIMPVTRLDGIHGMGHDLAIGPVTRHLAKLIKAA